MKQSILVAALTAFLLSLSTVQSANAQIFKPCGRACATFQRPRLFPRLFAFRVYPSCGGYSYGVDMTATGVSRCEGGRCPTSSPTCSGGTCVVDPIPDGEYIPTDEGNVPVERKTLLEIVNATRARYGLRALTVDASLERGAIAQATFCSQIGGLRHAGGVAEILAQNTSDFSGAIAQWLNSPAHFAILTSSRYTRCGIGVVRDSRGRVWHAVQFR